MTEKKTNREPVLSSKEKGYQERLLRKEGLQKDLEKEIALSDEDDKAFHALKEKHDEALRSPNHASGSSNDQEYNKALDAYLAKKKEHALAIVRLKDLINTADLSYRQDLVDQGTILSVEHLKQFFSMGGDYKTKAVHDVSFQIKQGECLGLVGESGCGKTTTGRCVIRLYDITSGSIYYKGYRINGGTRWNEKEIKWSQIHTKEKIASLRKKETDEINAIPLKSYELETQLNDLILHENEEIKEKSSPLDEDNEIILSSIRSNYDSRINELRMLLDAAQGSEEKQLATIRSYYESEIDKLVIDEKTHIAEQEEIIRQIKRDNRHVYDIMIPDVFQPEPNRDNPEAPYRVKQHTLMSEIQMIFQDPVDSLDPRMTVEDIIQEGLHIQGQYNQAENHQKCIDILNKVGLIPEYASRYPHEFSGGQRQRIGIARALVMNPRLLLCDEPISALDVSIRAQILNLLNGVKEEMGLTMLFIAHDLSVVKYFCDRIAVMYFGNLVELATSDELFKHPMHPYTRALLSAIPKPDPLSEKNRVRKVYNPSKVHDYSKEKPTLHEVTPGHFVLCNSPEFKKYVQEIAEMDAASTASTSSVATPVSEKTKKGAMDK
jgi:oligopeptide transport system ATP-binding protein